MTTFTIHAGLKVGACATNDSARHGATSSVVFVAGMVLTEGYLVATNGRALTVLPVGAAPEKPILLPPESVTANGKPSTVDIEDKDVYRTNGKKKECYEVQTGGIFPGVQRVCPEVAPYWRVMKIDAGLLAKIASAISPTDKLTLLIPPAKDGNRVDEVLTPVVVVGEGDEGFTGFGLIVPERPEPEAARDFYTFHRGCMPKENLNFNPPEENPSSTTR